MLKRVVSFIKLTRPVNLLIIAATMLTMRYGIVLPVLSKIGLELSLPLADFLLLTLSMVLMAASGNIINDYFDVRVDKINKPGRVIIDKGVKRRVAMGAHQVINVLAVGIVVWLAWKHNTWWPIAIPILLISGLWFYSATLQKMFLVGNVVVSLMVATVPLWAAVFELGLRDESVRPVWWMLGLFAVFAFLINLVREIMKDLEDAEGDKLQGYKTMPIVWGADKSKRFAAGWAGLLFILVVNSCFRFYDIFSSSSAFAIPTFILLMALPCFLLLIAAARASNKQQFRSASTLAKLCMLGALFFVGIWQFLP